MAGISVGGLVSGLDTNSIISQLTALEQAKVTREIQKQDNAKSTLEKFKELEAKLLSLQTKSKTLELPKDFNMFKSNSNYEDYATITGGEGAVAGSYDLVVKQLATAQKVSSKSFKAVNTAMSNSENMDWATVANGTANKTVTITLSTSAAAKKADPRNTEVDIKINDSDTLKDIVNKINAAEGAGVRASIMTLANGDNRIILTAVDTGTNGFYLKENGGTSLLSALGIVDYSEQKATSGNALTVISKDSTQGGGPATLDNTFKDLNTSLNKNDFAAGDKLGIYLPVNSGTGSAGWITFDLYDAGGNARKIGDVLTDVNYALKASGVNFEATLNSSGEIVLEGKLDDDQNFESSVLKDVKIQLGTFSGFIGTSSSPKPIAINDEHGIPIHIPEHTFSILTPDDPDKPSDGIIVKKDMGTLSSRNVFSNVITEGQNAFYTIDGIPFSSQSNDDDKVVAGATFNLKKADPEKVIRVSLEPDMSGVADKIADFINECNELLKFIDENAKAQVVEETDKSTGKKTSKRVVGVFTGDSGISSLRENLRNMLSGIVKEISNSATIETYNYSTGKTESNPNPNYNGYYTAYSSASRIGIVTNREGYYDIDKEKLTKALNADFEGVRKLFTNGGFSDTAGFGVGRFTKDSKVGVYVYNSADQKWYLNPERDKDGNYLFLDKSKRIEDIKGTWASNNIFTTNDGLSLEIPSGYQGTAQVTFSRGIAGQLSNFVETAKTGYYRTDGKWIDGYFKQSKDTYQKRIDEIQKRVDQLQMRVDNYNDRLVKQFTSLEKSIGNLQSQSSNMLSVLSSMNTGSNK